MNPENDPCRHCNGIVDYEKEHKCPALPPEHPPLMRCKYKEGRSRQSPDGLRSVTVHESTTGNFVFIRFDNRERPECPRETDIVLSKSAADALVMLLLELPGVYAGRGSA